MNTPEINDGGPAFPTPDSYDSQTQKTFRTQGMSLRQWYAGQALAGLAASQENLLSNHDLIKEFGTDGIDRLQASKARRLADALIAELERTL